MRSFLFTILISLLPALGHAQTTPEGLITREPSLDMEPGAALETCAEAMILRLLHGTRLEAARIDGIRFVPPSGWWRALGGYHEFGLVDDSRGMRFEGRVYVQIRNYGAVPSRGIREARTACELLRNCAEPRSAFTLLAAGDSRPLLATPSECPYGQR
jgi:hypothetical protein